MVKTRMRMRRETLGLSQAELARRAGLHSTTVSLIESKRMAPYPIQLAKIAEVLGVPAGDAGRLLEEVELPDDEFQTDAGSNNK